MRIWNLLTLLLLMVLVGCRQENQPNTEANLQIDLRAEPEAVSVGDSTLIITVLDASGQPVNDAKVTARADMNHAGMVPEIETVESGTNGEYAIPFEWSMAGDWIIEVTVELESGVSQSQTFDLLVEVS